ncbi:hypothetical protein BC826DRAFT_1084705 [Russula brevipes]|nr:hypothetical protein BC826DRAFT_1084705 [Russula brevipes]
MIMQSDMALSQDSAESKGPKFHPLFTFDADVVLGSRDGVLFRVPSMTLKMTSAWFRTMFTLPQGSPPARAPQNSNQRSITASATSSSSSSTAVDTETITLDEDSHTLESLLRMICGLEIPTLETWDAVEPDIRTASTRSLAANLYAPENRAALLRLRTSDLLALFELHHARRVQFRDRVAQAPFLTDAQLNDAAPPRCSRCREPISYSEWRELRHRMLTELENCPSGDTVLAGLEVWPTALACWSAKCKKPMCGSTVYDKGLTSKAIKDLLESLPNAVDVPVIETA